jgi:RNA polymerase-binding transcription factor DksA
MVAKKKAPAKKAAKKAPAKKAPAKKVVKKVAKKAPAKKAPAKAPAKKAVKKAAPKPPAPRKLTEADKRFFEQQRIALLSERATYTHQAESLRAEADSLTAEREPGDVQFDEESGEGDTLAVERDLDLALSNQALAAIEDIDLALQRIVDGTYGICEISGKPIPKARLQAIPQARVRVEYKAGPLTQS